MNTEQIIRLLKIIAHNDDAHSLWWKEARKGEGGNQYVEKGDLLFFIACNDVFAWGCADCELIEGQEDIDALERAYNDAEADGAHLFVARKRGMRPQGAMYQYIDKENRSFFDLCGPRREVSFGNPKEQEYKCQE